MVFWLYLYPASIFGGILYSTSVAGWESYAFFMWCAIPLHFFITQWMYSPPFGSKWDESDTACLAQFGAFFLGSFLVWDVVGVPLMSSWLGWVVRVIVGVAAVGWGGTVFSMLLGCVPLLFARLAPNSAVTRGVVWSFFKVGASVGAFDKANLQTEIDDYLHEASGGKTRRLTVNR